ncbi:MAG: NADP-dependent oxidoreductase [Rhodospirillales bacterium]|jgi:NADPH:quinone reductase-like Zn-dependent oxidoreductase|nr:NADPH:quinone reductase [Rhodospirillaceae bacterium]MDP6427328.1 NADP-dependent oxidoreductase [Rhodospirillales bacterium]MDP6643616.1 NADP-dependent oxidoreductase [Rhodospirillales bacterium]MDP6842816.1 NADP-dependent oxidoreductase [Rhodospirillales bacterium]|tara:strand:- start:4058 stop:4987 length:930 start_codon:yes stop_codon:yes gene_type:complete
MKAVQIDAFGGPEVLQVRDIADPAPGPGEALIDIHAATVNPADWKSRGGSYADPAEGYFPHILGRDFSGVVRELGDGAEGLSPGDEVYGVAVQGVDGAYAEAIAIDAGLVGLKPASISHDEAAALALTTLTAMIALEDTARLTSGQKLLVQGGAGGVGSLGIQIGHHLGAHVITTASPGNHDYVSNLGADEVIDYNSTDFTEAVSDCDVVFDTVGGEVHARSFAVLKAGGRMVWIAGQPEGFTAPRDDVEVMRPNVKRARAYMDRISEFITAGAVKAPEMQFMSLDQVREAHELSATGHVRGKIVFQVR